ncbi:MAG: hypothetical protein K2Y14_00950 [Burkholderiales bacterium]|nr:hypothetical protein [Burkholderiales bacterium]MBX9890393.1 hypothetical protein [Amoebophilaceae bacterium]
MKSIEILRAVYNDKEVLKKVKKSIDDYALNLKSMDQLKRDSKEIETHVKETYALSPTLFKKIVKASLTQNDTVDEVVDELQMINEIAKSK